MQRRLVASAKTGLACLRLLAVVAFDLVRPPKPENRLPRRWLGGGPTLV